MTSQKLCFSSSNILTDRFEGFTSEADKQRIKLYKEHLKGFKEMAEKIFAENPEKIKDVSYLSCWSKNDIDSLELWWRFIGSVEFGVAIISTRRKIRDSLKINKDIKKRFFHGDITYGDFTPLGNSYNFYFRKDPRFQIEREYRILFQNLEYPVCGDESIIKITTQKIIIKQGTSLWKFKAIKDLIDEKFPQELVHYSTIQV